jgi:hypothetical protein
MHRVAASILSLSLFAAPAMARTQHVVKNDACANAAERTAFDTEGLKSELMVTAETCRLTDKYNTFIRAYQPVLATQESALNAYFKRGYGRSSEKAHDDYITNLANVQSQEGLKSGTAFCQIAQNMFDEVMSLHDGSELADYAHSQAIVQPVAFTSCSEVPVKTLSRPRHRAARHKTA